MPPRPSTSRNAAVRSLLTRLGLDERETAVYLALLPLKVARASAIARASGQSRSHTYLVLRSLREKGLVSETEKGKVLHFVAESPKRLGTYLEDRADELRELRPLVTGAIPFLESLTALQAVAPRVTMLQGYEGMKQTYRDLLPHEFRGLLDADAMYRTFDTNIVSKLFGKDAVLRGRDLLVQNPAARRFVQDVRQNDGYAIRVLPPGIDFSTDTVVAGDTVAFFPYDTDLTVIRIESPPLARTVAAWFDALWVAGEKTESGFREPML